MFAVFHSMSLTSYTIFIDEDFSHIQPHDLTHFRKTTFKKKEEGSCIVLVSWCKVVYFLRSRPHTPFFIDEVFSQIAIQKLDKHGMNSRDLRLKFIYLILSNDRNIYYLTYFTSSQEK